MSEKTFVDRHARGESLRDHCAGFSPAFAPADAALTVGNFTTFLGTVATLNTEIGTLTGNYTTQAATRVTTVKTIKAVATRVAARLKSNAAWQSEEKSARQVLNKLRGKRPPKPKAPEPGESPAEEKKRNSGEQAYAEVAALWEKFIGVATAAPGYATGAPGAIAPGALTGLLSTIRGANSFLSGLAAQIGPKQKKRQALYFEPGGLQAKFLSIKEAVKSQYGTQSAEYGSVKGLRW